MFSDLNLDENQDDILPETVAGPSCIRRLSECTVDEPFADSGSDYLPSDSSSASPTHDSENHRVLSPVVYDIEGTARRERKRRLVAKPELWKKNKMKLLRVAGKEYVNRKGAIVTAKSPGIVNCNNCRYKCSINIPRDRQIIICKEYWEMADSTKQKIFICSLVEEKNIDRERNRNDRKKTRKHSRYYHLLSASNKRVRVCQKYFCATFAFSFQVVETALKYRGDSGVYVGFDHRKGRPAPNVTSAEQVRHIKTHIDMFPRMASHYCRRDTMRQYLASDLNISVIYRLYCSNYCLQNNVPSVKYNVFRSVFNSYDPPLSFYKPKKDQCVTCNVYNSATDKTELQSQWEAHKAKEKSGMEMKAADKQKAVDNKGETFRAITFDLQSILNVPYAGDSQIFYRRKLSVYNFTIFDASNADGYSYLWDETQGKKGSVEIGSCLLKYLQSLPNTVTHVSSFSDTCGGQNRNKYVTAAMLYAVANIDNLEVIDLKYLEPGHTYLEVDSMHATIERARRNKKVYTPREWGVLIQMARLKPRPYIVTHLTYLDFYNFKELASKIMVNTTCDTDGNQVKWLQIKWLRFIKTNPSTIFFKYDVKSNDFLKLNIRDVGTKRTRTRKQCENVYDVSLEQQYTSLLPISNAKKHDLLCLLREKVIPGDYKNFVEMLPTAVEAIDIVPSESDYETD